MVEEINEKRDFESEILAILRSDLSAERKEEALDEFHDHELGEAFLAMNKDDRKRFALLLSPKLMASIIAELDPEDVIPLLKEMHISDAGKILNEMQGDDLVDVLQAFETRDERVTYLSLVTLEKRNSIKNMIDYNENLVGSIMNNNFVEIDRSATVKSAIKKLVQVAPQVEFINNLYVTENQTLVGVLSLKEIMSAGNQPDRPVDDLMTINLITVMPTTPKEDAIEIMKNYDFYLLPVVNEKKQMLGIISFDDMAEAIDKESETDYSQMAGVTDINIDEESENIVTTVKKRFPWLAILLFLDLISSSIVAGFEHVLTQIPLIALFMPLILNMAGNTGTQSLGVVITLFAVNELDEKKSVVLHLLKEILIGIINGIAIGLLLFGMVLLMQWIRGESISSGISFALVISLSIAISLVACTFVGALIPVLMRLVRIDPAVASGPFITTIADIVSLLLYFSLAILFLGLLG